MKGIILTLLSLNIIFSDCTPLEVSVYMNEMDGWMFPYSTFFAAMSQGVLEIQEFNNECYQLLEINSGCIMDCMNMEQDQIDINLGRIGCIYYNCPDGESLIQNYEEHYSRPTHLYGQLYCDEDTEWDSMTNSCKSNICNGDFNGDNNRNVSDIVIMVQNILNGQGVCGD